MFSLVIDALSKFHLQRLIIILYFLNIVILSLIALLYSVTALLESFLEFLPQRLRQRFLISGCVSLFCASIGFYLNLPNGVLIHSELNESCIRTVQMIIILIATIAIIFIYSIGSIIEDAHFIYGQLPSNYWITPWTISPLILLVISLFYLYLHTVFTIFHILLIILNQVWCRSQTCF